LALERTLLVVSGGTFIENAFMLRSSSSRHKPSGVGR
jgi:hypothetical protein